MAIIMRGYYTPGHKPEPSLHDKLAGLRMTSYPGSGKDVRPLPIAKNGGCFKTSVEKMNAHNEWVNTYQKRGA